MTLTDWVGTILAIVIALLMFGAYFYAFRPANKEKFKNYENLVNQQD
jgi:cytochrome c oxidase cbb3-type subunit 4